MPQWAPPESFWVAVARQISVCPVEGGGKVHGLDDGDNAGMGTLVPIEPH